MSNNNVPRSNQNVNVQVRALTIDPAVTVQYKTKILHKNVVNGVNTLTQEMMSAQNIKYVIKYDYVLGENITIPASCVLEFDGGSISNASGNSYTLTGNNTIIYYTQDISTLFNNVETQGTFEYNPIGVENVTDIAKPFIINYETTPQQFGAIGNGTSHLLSSVYDTLAEAQEKYPFVDSLNWEIDTCAMQAALNYCANNNGSRLYIPRGAYMINRELLCLAVFINMEGETCGNPEGGPGGATLLWNGEAGTEDNPKFIFKLELKDPATQQFYPEAPLKYNYPQFSYIANLCFRCQTGSMSSPSYVSAIRTYGHLLYQIDRCNFGNVYDGIVTISGMISSISNCKFYGVTRDCISTPKFKGSFTTTIRIFRNEFGYFGRYAIFFESGGTASTPEIFKNSFEGAFNTSAYYNKPAYFYQGVQAVVCLVHQSGGYFLENRFEGNAFKYDLHLAASSGLRIEQPYFEKGIICTCASTNTNVYTADYNSFYEEHGYSDVNDDRNQILYGSPSDPTKPSGVSLTMCDTIKANVALDWNPNFLNIACTDINHTSLDLATYTSVFQGLNTIKYVPVVDNALDVNNIIQVYDSIGPTGYNMYSAKLWNIVDYKFDPNIPSIRNYFSLSGMNFRVGRNQQLKGYNGWNIEYLAVNPLTNAEAYFLDQPFIYANLLSSDETVSRYYEVGVVKKRKIRYEYSAAPNSGTWNRGDMVYNKNPSAGGYIGWVCVTAGTPGTWKGFGLIEA